MSDDTERLLGKLDSKVSALCTNVRVVQTDIKQLEDYNREVNSNMTEIKTLLSNHLRTHDRTFKLSLAIISAFGASIIVLMTYLLL